MSEETTVPASGGDEAHLDLAALAELDEGLLDPDRADRARAHVEGCPVCQDERRRLRAVGAALRSLPAEPMPAPVAGRLDDSLRGATATIVPAGPPARRRWRSRPTAAALSAVAAAVALVVAVVLGTTLGSGSGSSGEQAGPAAGAAGASAARSKAAPFPVLARGAHYTQTNAARLIGQLVPAPAAAASVTAPPAAARVPTAMRPLYTDRAALLRCVALLAGNSTTQPLAVDFGTYTDKKTVGVDQPAVVIVLPGSAAGRDEGWIVGPGCVTDPDNDFYLYQTVPASG